MTRTQKLERIKKYRPILYRKLAKHLPNLLNNPGNATPEDIFSYNNFIISESKRDAKPEAFIRNFSF